MKTRAGLLGLVIAAGSLVGCGSGGSGGQSTQPAPTTFRDEGTGTASGVAAPGGSTPTSPPQRASDITLPNAWDIVITDQSGYRFDVKLEVADQTVKVGTRHGELVAGETCELDSRKDALIPARVTLTNSTPGFSAKLTSRFYFLAFPDAAELGYSEPSCVVRDNGQGGLFSIGVSRELATGESVPINIFIVVRDYYTPASPNGNLATLQRIKLGVADQAATMERLYDVDSVTGPSVPVRKAISTGWDLPIGMLVTA